MSYDERIELPRGRILGYLDEGDRGANAVLFCHDSPGCRLGAVPLVAPTADRGGHLIAPDRPGLGLSDPQPGRSLAGWAADVADLTERLGQARFRILGVGAGGPFALALAWALPNRVERVALLGSTASFDVPGATDGMRRSARLTWRMARWSPRLLGWMLQRQARIAQRDPDRFAAAVEASLGTLDRDAWEQLDSVERSYLIRELPEALRQGAYGAVDDMRLSRAPWGFGPQDVQAPVRLWHGEADEVAPLAMGGWLAAMLPDVEAQFEPGAGHLGTIVGHRGDALDWLLG